MKGVIFGFAPDAVLVDLTHDVPPQEVRAGAHLLATAAPHFPPGTIHLAVVDPGVGTRRRALVVESQRALFVAPDNGLLSFAVPPGAAVATTDVSRSPVRRVPMSRTFHGRDLFAPVAAHLALGVPAARLGRPTSGMLRLRRVPVRRLGRALVGRVLWADRFGNLSTNVSAADLVAAGAFRGRGVSVTIDHHVLSLRGSYADVPVGRAVALVNSADHLEIAVHRGSAASTLGLGPGARVVVRPR